MWMTYPDCLQCVSQAWENLNTAVVKKARELGMAADLGPEIEGYVNKHFQDAQPSGDNVEVADSEFANDLQAED